MFLNNYPIKEQKRKEKKRIEMLKVHIKYT